MTVDCTVQTRSTHGQPGGRSAVVAVAYSGGRDSTALLHATLREAAAHDLRAVALHVQHGLNRHADAWLEHCAAQCGRWADAGWPIEFEFQRLTARPASGESVEAWAREERYSALRTMAQAHGASLVLLAHHRRDQGETLLLQALRGAGVAGLSGMPCRVERDGITWCRPWLDRPREEIEAYLGHHRLDYIDDESNTDARFARNRLRIQVWPALSTAFPQAEAALANAAQWAQEAAAALGELAVLDLARSAGPDGLRVPAWLELSAARRSNALRAWLRRECGTGAPASLVRRLAEELPVARSARWPLSGNFELRAYRGVLQRAPCNASPQSDGRRERTLCVDAPGVYRLPGWSGSLEVRAAAQAGVPIEALARLALRERSGAERFQAGVGRPPRCLKKQFQAAGVPAWERRGPVVYGGDADGPLLFVPGLGADARQIVPDGESLMQLRWLPDPHNR